ncbi:conserved exported hypothetical protein [Gammaproteobacteria bacterium]
MKRAKGIGFCLGGIALLACWTLTIAQAADPADGKGSNIVDKKGEESQNEAGLSEFAMAQQLVRYGIAHHDALPLISAAKIMKQNPPQIESRAKTSTSDNGSDAAAGDDDEKAQNKEDLSNPEGVLAKARELAGAKTEMLAIIDSVTAYIPPKTRGRVGGPTKHHDRVGRNRSDYYVIRFRGGQAARIFVLGDGDTDLDCFVYDTNRNLVAVDQSYGDNCQLSWTPAWTSTFTVRIANFGRVSNRYVLLTN